MSDNLPPDISGPDLEALEAELPALTRLRDFTTQAARQSWFAELGDPLTPTTRETAQQFLDMLGFPDASLTPVANWADTAAAAQSLDWDPTGWEAEEQLRASVAAQALTVLSEEALTLGLADLSARLQPILQQALEEAAALYDEEDTELINAALGAALQAAHGAALATVCETGPDHPLLLKYQLFCTGHWPIGIAGLSFNLF